MTISTSTKLQSFLFGLLPKRLLQNTNVLICLIMALAACGGGSDSGSSAVDNRQLQLFQDATVAYQAADYSSAVNLFGQLLAEFPNSNLKDESHYKLGRSYQYLNNFSAARDAYTAVSNSSNRVDNAAFYIGKSFYDEAGTLTDPATAYASYELGIGQLNVMLTTYGTSSFVNEAHYYKGRSYQEQASLKQTDSTITTKTDLELFTDARVSFDVVASTSVFDDNAQYFKARTYHEQIPPDYINARTEYQVLINANVSSWADDALYQYGKSFYDEAGDMVDANNAMQGFGSAIAEFDILITSTNPLYQTSNRADSSRYYKGRSLHKQAELVEIDPTLGGGVSFGQYFQNARNTYQAVIDLDRVDIYADNAQYQIGKTYYDEALIALALNDYPLMQQNLSDAIAAFTIVVTDTVYQASNTADNAYYYLGRSYHAAAEIPTAERAAITGGIDFTTVTYASARSQYEILTGTTGVAPQYPNSTWIDNAYYEIGNTWYAEAQTAVDPLASYNAALDSYKKVLDDYQANSIREDNAALQIGLIYHEAGYCSNEQAAFDYLVTSIVSAKTSSIDEANLHLDDLAIALITPTTTHPCVENPVGMQNFIQPVAKISLEQTLFLAGLNLYQQQDYANAITQFQSQITSFPVGLYADDAQLYIGRSYYWSLDYVNAERQFRLILADYSSGNMFDRAQYWLAKNFHARGDYLFARNEYLLVPETSVWFDNAQFQIGKTLYDESKTAANNAAVLSLLSEAEQSLAAMIASYPASSSVDDAQYYLARSYHDLARLVASDNTLVVTKTAAEYFVNARTTYRAIDTASSSFADDATYQIGKTYYDESKTATNNGAIFVQLTQAEQNLAAMIASYPTSSNVDDAQYYLARSYHELALLVASDSSLTGVLTAAEYFDKARNAYLSIDAATSIFADNAAYLIGKSYYDAAKKLLPAEAMLAYENARAEFDNFLANSQFVSSTKQYSVQYYKGRCDYEQGLLVKDDPALSLNSANSFFVAARDSFNAIVALTPGTTVFEDDAQYYLANSYHVQATPDFINARLAYQVLVGNKASSWSDDAMYQMGRTFYDEAELQIDAQFAMNDYASAIVQFDLFLADSVYQTSTKVDVVNYYRGRSFHRQAMLAANNATITADVNQLYANARTAYATTIALGTLETYADNARYYLGKSQYDEAGLLNDVDAMLAYDAAVIEFSAFNVASIYEISSYNDQARYYLGLSRHRQALLIQVDSTLVTGGDAAPYFAWARDAYQTVINLGSSGTYADNAQYRTSMSYYDEAIFALDLARQAEASADTVTAAQYFTNTQEKTAMSINEFNTLITDVAYAASSYLDNAHYYLGKNYHQASTIPLSYRLDLSLTLGINFIPLTLSDARVHYSELTTNIVFIDSAWRDNAFFEIGNTWYTEAQVAVDNLVMETAYNNALDSYIQIATNYVDSIRYDNSVYQIGLIYHETGYCTDEVNWFTYLVDLVTAGAAVSTTFEADASDHLSDLVPGPSILHTCGVPVLTGITSHLPLV